MTKNQKGFTLIELLIVVAIIGILAAIAIPNFLNAQVRAKVARGKSEMQSVQTALESYRVDNSDYPPAGDIGAGTGPAPPNSGYHSRTPSFLTTPVSYIKTLPFDPFMSQEAAAIGIYRPETLVWRRYAYYNTVHLDGQGKPYDGMWGSSGVLITWAGAHLIYGYGPDKDWTNGPGSNNTLMPYDPTNGTVSYGNIIRSQKKADGIPVHPETGNYLWP